jgi:hypothetical protein
LHYGVSHFRIQKEARVNKSSNLTSASPRRGKDGKGERRGGKMKQEKRRLDLVPQPCNEEADWWREGKWERKGGRMQILFSRDLAESEEGEWNLYLNGRTSYKLSTLTT